MTQSTVADSILGAFNSIGGINGRRAQDGLTAAQAEKVALENTATKRVLEDDENSRQAGELWAGGFAQDSADGKSVDVDFVKLANENKDLFRRVIGADADKWLTTRGPDGKPMKLEFAGIQKVPAQMGAAAPLAPTPGQMLDNQKGPVSLLGPLPTPSPAAAPVPEAGPDRYMIMVKTQDGRVVPATQNASADPADPLITLSADEINGMGRARVNRMQAGGAFGNVAVQQGRMAELATITDAYMQQKILDTGGDTLTDDPTGKRGLFDVVNTASGADLEEIARDAGLNPEALRKEALDKWTADHKTATAAVKVNPADIQGYTDSKILLERLVGQADKALADFDSKARGSKESIDQAMIDVAAAESGRIGRPSRMSENKPSWSGTAARKTLVAARDDAAAKLAALKPPVAKASTTPAPKFEFTDAQLREQIKSGLQAMPEGQMAELASYGREQGVQKAADLAKLPPARAKQLMMAIVANTPGGPAAQMTVFEKLNNYIQTEDPGNSAIDANVAIAGAQAQQGQVANQAAQVRASIDNSIRDYNAAMAGVAQKDRELQRDLYKDNTDMLGKIDDAFGKVTPLMDAIYKGALTPDNKFNPNGPTSEAMASWKTLDAYTTGLPAGSPMKYAASKRYLEGFMTMAAAQASKPGAVAWWDWTKMFANTFLREDGMVDLSPLVEQATVKKWKNGLPEEITFGEGGARQNKPTGATVGAAEFSRYLGTSGMKTFVDAIYMQKAANVLGQDADPAAIYAKSEELKKADGA